MTGPRIGLSNAGAVACKMTTSICRGGRYSLEEIDEAVARHYRIDARLFSAHGRSVGCAKSVAVELAAQLADLSGRAIGARYEMCANGVGANRRRLATRPEVLQVIDTLGRKLRRRKLK